MVPGLASEAEALWYDPQRWPAWVDGFGHVVKLEGDVAGGGRARRVGLAARRPRARRRARVGLRGARGADARGRGREAAGTQTVTFEPGADGVEVALELEYELKQRNVFTPLTDVLFIRRALRDSLRRSLTRFAHERRSDLEL